MTNRDRTITPEMATLIKGMLARGDAQSDIAAYFMVNSGRVSEINTGHSSTGEKFAHITAAPDEQLPPVDFPSAFELTLAGHSLWEARVALEHTKEKIEIALAAIERAEAKVKP